MARPDLISALKNALERGESIQQAKLSLISSGYPQLEVEEAALALTQVSVRQRAELQIPVPIKAKPLFPFKPVPPKSPVREPIERVEPFASPEAEMQRPEKLVKKKGVPWFILLLIILLGLVGYIIFLMVKRLSI